ncbi:MAG: hypothetical protein EOO27_41985, partial [Comamonadaceae bacterium]
MLHDDPDSAALVRAQNNPANAPRGFAKLDQRIARGIPGERNRPLAKVIINGAGRSRFGGGLAGNPYKPLLIGGGDDH